jgi:hypothetical protein
MMRVGSFLERAEDALRKTVSSTNYVEDHSYIAASCVIDVGSGEDMGVELYGCFSPRVWDGSPSPSTLPSIPSTIEGEAIAKVVPPVLEIMPELQELCESSALPR